MGFKIGVMLDSFRDSMDNSLKKTVQVGASGLQVYATSGEMAPEAMDKAKRKEFVKKVQDHGLVISALCGDLGWGFHNPDKNPESIARSKQILLLAKDLECDIVTTHIGVVPQAQTHPRYSIMQDACGELARFADSVDAHFAVETGPEKSEVLKGFLDGLHSKGVAVNFDPANLVMVAADDPALAVHNLREYIVHTHAKDGIQHFYRKPEYVYGIEPDPAPPEAGGFSEVPLGQGQVQYDTYLAALADIGYHGFLTIEREVGEDPYADILNAAVFLRGKI